ncbi:PREDICTED: 7-deoxyloganetic acid glucosyltransferase-like [Ipomoea nil]|uniref:7-deoxyloganetic acid glucosyltransferase-like n=1 Tax=Ipomoea nil TaxID=35883 RepID=UPI000901D00F|nr:PREDICTED: 7-deoxyloganetic acid glucosyltransferase-like [Ipomoea nil]
MENPRKLTTTTTNPPHVLIFPLPLQGPVNSMLKLAEIFCLHDIHVTFLNTHHVHRRLFTFSDAGDRFAKYPNFRFATLPDGLPEDNPRTGDQILELIECIEKVTSPLFREMVTAGAGLQNPVTCLLVDGIFTFAVDVAREIGVPLLYFDTISPCGLWSYMCVPKLIEAGELPFRGNDLDSPIKSAPGFGGILRRRDMPSLCRADDINDPIIQLVLKEDQHLPQAQGLIFNTFLGLEGPILAQFRDVVCPNVYAVGPLHSHLKTRLAEGGRDKSRDVLYPTSSNSLWREDERCIEWLDRQVERSVLYVSIGSMAIISRDRLMELWYGLVNSGTRFLWVQRPGSVMGGRRDGDVPEELIQGTEKRGCIVDWAPQEKVLAHPSIRGFLTHGGWNSTLESIVEGVPMICWPFFVDQHVNSRFVEEVWKVGLDMKDLYDRGSIERMIRDLMEDKKDEFLKRASEMAYLAKQSIGRSGSSYQDLDRLIEDIRLMRIGS